MQSVLSAVGIMFNTLSAKIEQSLRRLEAERVCDYRPAFQTTAGKPSHDAIKTWARGFWRAMALTTEWHALAVDERTQVIITPFVGFIDVGSDEAFEVATDIHDRLMRSPPRSLARSAAKEDPTAPGKPNRYHALAAPLQARPQ